MTLFEITAATIMALTSNAGMNGEYYYDTETENNVVSSQTVYSDDNAGNYLEKTYKYNFKYDEQNRLLSKETLKWDSSRQKWLNNSIRKYNYDADGYSVEYARWDEERQQYSDIKQKCDYSLVDENAIAVSTYNWNDNKKSYELASRDVIYNPNAERLFAKANK